MVRLTVSLVAVAADAQQTQSTTLADGWFVTSDSVRLHYLSGGGVPRLGTPGISPARAKGAM